MITYIRIDCTSTFRSLDKFDKPLEINKDDTSLLQQCYSVARVSYCGPSLSVDPVYELSPTPSILGAFVVGSTPYLPYIFWSIET